MALGVCRMDILKTLEKVVDRVAPGPTLTFTQAHVVRALEEANLRDIGRLELSRRLELGTGVTRTLIRHLQNYGLIVTSKSGITTSKLGKKFCSTLRNVMSEQLEVPLSPLTLGSSNVAVLLRNMAGYVKTGLELRDAAIMVGAKGATTLIYSKQKLIMPDADSETDVSKADSNIHNLLTSKLKPKENDAIIIGSANTKAKAELGVRMAALRLLKSSEYAKKEA